MTQPSLGYTCLSKLNHSASSKRSLRLLANLPGFFLKPTVLEDFCDDAVCMHESIRRRHAEWLGARVGTEGLEAFLETKHISTGGV